MSNEPVMVTYSLEEVLTRLETKIDNLQQDVTDLKVGQARIEEKLDSVNKRLENQEFITRGIVVGLVLAFLAGFAKLLGIIGNP